MVKYILKRILYVIPVMFGVLIIVFALKSIMPGDPVDMILSSDASAEERQAKREELGLDKPIAVQFAVYVKGIVTELDFGTSYKTNQPVFNELMQRFPITFILAIGSVFAGTLLAIPLGFSLRSNSIPGLTAWYWYFPCWQSPFQVFGSH